MSKSIQTPPFLSNEFKAPNFVQPSQEVQWQASDYPRSLASHSKPPSVLGALEGMSL